MKLMNNFPLNSGIGTSEIAKNITKKNDAASKSYDAIQKQLANIKEFNQKVLIASCKNVGLSEESDKQNEMTNMLIESSKLELQSAEIKNAFENAQNDKLIKQIGKHVSYNNDARAGHFDGSNPVNFEYNIGLVPELESAKELIATIYIKDDRKKTIFIKRDLKIEPDKEKGETSISPIQSFKWDGSLKGVDFKTTPGDYTIEVDIESEVDNVKRLYSNICDNESEVVALEGEKMVLSNNKKIDMHQIVTSSLKSNKQESGNGIEPIRGIEFLGKEVEFNNSNGKLQVGTANSLIKKDGRWHLQVKDNQNADHAVDMKNILSIKNSSASQDHLNKNQTQQYSKSKNSMMMEEAQGYMGKQVIFYSKCDPEANIRYNLKELLAKYQGAYDDELNAHIAQLKQEADALKLKAIGLDAEAGKVQPQDQNLAANLKKQAKNDRTEAKKITDEIPKLKPKKVILGVMKIDIYDENENHILDVKLNVDPFRKIDLSTIPANTDYSMLFKDDQGIQKFMEWKGYNDDLNQLKALLQNKATIYDQNEGDDFVYDIRVWLHTGDNMQYIKPEYQNPDFRRISGNGEVDIAWVDELKRAGKLDETKSYKYVASIEVKDLNDDKAPVIKEHSFNSGIVNSFAVDKDEILLTDNQGQQFSTKQIREVVDIR